MNRIYWIPNLQKGMLGMMARPRGHDWLEEDIIKLKLKEVDMVVSLLERNESYELGLHLEKTLCSKHGIAFRNFPITDRAVPDDQVKFIRFIESLQTELEKDLRIVVHCRMGIGRTSMTCAAILLKQGFDQDLVFEHLSEVRTLEVPDTSEQQEWVLSL